MSDEKRNNEQLLDLAIDAVRADELAPEQVQKIADRVWNRLSEDAGESTHESVRIRGCADFQALIPAYIEGELSQARTLLLEDHTRECIPCRKAMTAARTKNVQQVAFERKRKSFSPWLKWGSVAATIMLAAVLVQWGIYSGLFPGVSSVMASVDGYTGQLFTLDDNALKPLAAGEAINVRQTVRTAKGSGAVLELTDGSRVELAERTEVALVAGWSGTTIQLQRGNVIIEAADQGSGRLFVSTGDCRVAVKGTVFSVAHGVQGSRVSVLEGEVWVEKGGENTVLTPGQQYASQKRLAPVALAEDFAWSQKAEKHLALLSELSALNKDIQRATYGAQLRYTTDLAGLLPEGTVVYAAFPNISSNLDDLYQQFLARVQASPALQDWWAEAMAEEDGPAKLEELLAKVSALGGELGDEIVLAVVPGTAEGEAGPVVLARVLNAETLRALAQAEVDAVNAKIQADPVVFVIDDPYSVAEDAKGVFILIQSDLMAVSPSVPLLRQIVDGNGGFEASRFFQTVASSYASGVDWLFAVNMERMQTLKTLGDPEGAAEAEDMSLGYFGITQVQDLVVERKQAQGVPENRAVLTYAGTGSGLASWLASPGAMGGLEYVSQDANLATAFVLSDPAGLVDDLLNLVEQNDATAWADLVQFQLDHGVNIRQDIAAPLGGEFIFALDGPMLPTPSWKVIVEVYDAMTFERTIALAIEEVNRKAMEEGVPGLSFRHDEVAGMNSIRVDATGMSFYYRFVDGYMIMAPDPALITQAEQYRASQTNLANSPRFTSLLPQDTNVSVSAVFYHNLAPLVEPILNSPLGASLSQLSPEGQASLSSLIGSTPPMLVSLSSQPGRMTVASGGDLETMLLNMSTLSALGGPEGISKALQGQMVTQ